MGFPPPKLVPLPSNATAINAGVAIILIVVTVGSN